MVTDDAIQTTYIQSDQEMFLFTSANSSLSHIIVLFLTKPFFDELNNGMPIILLYLCYSVSYMFKGDVHFH